MIRGQNRANMLIMSRTISDLVLFASEVLAGRPHSKKEATEFFRDLVAWDESRANEIDIATQVVAQASRPNQSSPIVVERTGNNSIFLGSESSRFYTFDEARALAAEIVKIAK